VRVVRLFLIIALLFPAILAAQEPTPTATPESKGPSVDQPHPGLTKTYRELNGKIIRKIEIRILDIFPESKTGFPYGQLNKLKANTKQSVVRRELLFKEGDEFDSFKLQESERVLRTLGYLRRVKITPKADGNFVDIKVQVQDTWTFVPQFSYSTGVGRTRYAVGIAESNLLGYGKRAEIFYEEDENRSIIEGVWDDNRVFGSDQRLVAAYFDRSDGQRTLLSLSNPIRSLLDDKSWQVVSDTSNSIGRLFENGDESYIFRQRLADLSARYTFSFGNPEKDLQRYGFGYGYQEARFSQADAKDYLDLDLDPGKVSNDAAGLADDRRFTGPVLSFQDLRPYYISRNYIDRFDRVEDYNLGQDFSLTFFMAPAFLGSKDDALLFSSNYARGYKFNESSFIRGEAGVGGRYSTGGFADLIARLEGKYYYVLGPLYLKRLFLGRHTLASNFFMDYGYDLDADRQFTMGGDNGVRGYEARTFTGDKRLVLNLEDRVHIVDDLFRFLSLGTAAFFDVGGASYDNLGTLISDQLYPDVGIGLRFGFPRSTGGGIMRIDLAFPLRDGPDGSRTWEIRAIFAAGQLFTARTRSESLGPERATVSVGYDR
jgi:outer membrane protein assembly factor BamA